MMSLHTLHDVTPYTTHADAYDDEGAHVRPTAAQQKCFVLCIISSRSNSLLITPHHALYMVGIDGVGLISVIMHSMHVAISSTEPRFSACSPVLAILIMYV